MSIQSALFTGASGLSTYSSSIQVIGNNIANVNTTGFKESRGNFADVLSESSGSSGDLQIGRGVRMNNVETLFTQGSFQATTRASDLAIDGEGFFIVRHPETNEVLYTRAGSFSLNNEGDLVNPQGMILQGFDLDTTGNAVPFVKNINISGQAFPPELTTETTSYINLSSRTEPLTAPFDLTNPSGTSNFSTSVTVYDALGSAHTAEMYFRKTAANDWDWNIAMVADDLAGGPYTTPRVTVASGNMTFTDTGDLDTIITTDALNYATGTLDPLATSAQGAVASFSFSNGSQANQAIDFDFGWPAQLYDSATGTYSANNTPNNNTGGTTQLASDSTTLSLSQNGFGSGVLKSFSVDQAGVVRGLFSTGQTLALTRIALAKFPSTSGLNLVGESLYGQSPYSGEPVVSSPDTSGLGNIVSNSLELSNVDLGSQFVELIRAQQAFQANSRIITTGDELLTEIVNLKR
jgi:flagellar hook protein FlgE